MGFELAVVNGRAVHDIVHAGLSEVVRVVEQAYLTHHAGKTVNPNSAFLLFPEKPSARIISLPAFLGGEFGVAGIKWIASYPENVARGFPRASAVLVLNDYETGYPFAFLESSIISAARTAASAALAALWLKERTPRAGRLGIVGTGLIARYLYRFLVGTGWSVDEVALFDLRADDAARFQKEAIDAGAHRKVEIAPTLEALVRSSDLIAFTTVAASPHVHDPAWFAHAPVVLNVSLRDLSPEVILASENVVDDVEHVMRAGTSLHLTEQRERNRRFVGGTLAEVMLGGCSLDGGRPRVFSPFGLGVLDLAVGKWVYDQAIASGRALRLDDFFYELTR